MFKKFINIINGKIIIFSVAGIALLTTIVGGVVVGVVYSNKNGGGNNNPITHHEYKGLFKMPSKKIVEATKETLDLNTLKIPNSTLTLKGKSLTVKDGIINAKGTISNKFNGNLLSIIKFQLIIPTTNENLTLTINFTIQENSTKDTIILIVNEGGIIAIGQAIFDLPLSW